jgi:hypothetical protein
MKHLTTNDDVDLFSVQSSFFEKHLKMLINEAEHKVEDLTLSVVHASNGSTSENKVRTFYIQPGVGLVDFITRGVTYRLGNIIPRGRAKGSGCCVHDVTSVSVHLCKTLV